MSETTLTSTLPPLPGPAVELAIRAPPWTVRLFATSVTEPLAPDCGPVAEAAIWAPPASAMVPGVATLTEPPAPVPAVVLAISAPLAKVICGAFTVADPAFTVTLPAFPVLAAEPLEGPNALLEIAPPLTIERAPAATVTSPAFRVLPALEFAAMPVSKLGLPTAPSIVS